MPGGPPRAISKEYYAVSRRASNIAIWKWSALAAVLTLAALAVPAQAAPNAEPELSIHFFDKRIYFPGSEIPLKITIANNGTSTYRFKLADDRAHSLSFETKTPSNRGLEPSDEYKLALGESKPVLYRELTINPGEEYSFVERLDRFVTIAEPGGFTVRAFFHPELVSPETKGVLASNALTLSVRPSPGLPPASELIRAATGEVLKAQALPPDEVVRKTIVARQKGLWNEFFLYIDLEALLSRDDDKRLIYQRESDEGRRRMIERFKTDLQASMAENDIATIPYSFDVIETRYSPGKGYVRVLEKFQFQQLRLVKEYTYELVRRDDIWFIVGYSVMNKGTE
jgi:hypothetical protein